MNDTKQRKIYVASSWRNELQQGVVYTLRAAGHEVYDFRNPVAGLGRTGARGHGTAFQWSEIDPDWQRWTKEQYRAALDHPVAVAGFDNDYGAMRWADTGVMVMPCGRSAHIEAGYFNGAGKDLFILQPQEAEPELMYRMADAICLNLDQLLQHVGIVERKDRVR